MSVVFFVLLAGAQIAAVRAGSMAVIALIARITYREYDGIRALLLVASLMVLYNPNSVLFSVSFHLSFLATLGLLLFSPIIEKKLHFFPEKLQIRSIVSSTLATQIFLLPYLAYSIGEVSLVGIVANIVILPIIPVAMLFGSLLTGISMVAPSISLILAPLAYLPLRGIIFLAEFFSRAPYAIVLLPEISAAWVVALFLFWCISAVKAKSMLLSRTAVLQIKLDGLPIRSMSKKITNKPNQNIFEDDPPLSSSGITYKYSIQTIRSRDCYCIVSNCVSIYPQFTASKYASTYFPLSAGK